MEKEIEKKIIEIIENINPYFNMEGGNIEFIKYEDNYIYIRLNGACNNCLLKDNEINENLLYMFQEEIPEIKGIINVPL